MRAHFSEVDASREVLSSKYLVLRCGDSSSVQSAQYGVPSTQDRCGAVGCLTPHLVREADVSQLPRAAIPARPALPPKLLCSAHRRSLPTSHPAVNMRRRYAPLFDVARSPTYAYVLYRWCSAFQQGTVSHPFANDCRGVWFAYTSNSIEPYRSRTWVSSGRSSLGLLPASSPNS